MGNNPRRCLLISDFNLDNFAACLRNNDLKPHLDPHVAPFGQVTQTIVNDQLAIWEKPFEFAVVWTTPENAIPSFHSVLEYQETPIEQVVDEVDLFVDRLRMLLDRVRFVFVPTWVTPAFNRGLGLLDLKTGQGISNTLMRMNLHLIDALESVPGLHALNAQRWVAAVGPKAFHAKLWYLAKIAFSNEVFHIAAKDLKSGLTALTGGARKLIVVDLDNTLWGGVVGDLGWENVRLGGHDPIGEGFKDFQQALKSLTNSGLLLAISSKNDEQIALEAIRRNPEMVLREEDFAGWRINWNDKAANIAELVDELNLGLQSVIFIDDNPVERERVRDALPDVFVPEWPRESMAYKSELLSLPYLDAVALSSEDRARSRQYVSEHQRRSTRDQVGSLDDWIQGLDLKVQVEPLSAANVQRVTQLVNKTNQMNLAVRRMTGAELTKWAGAAEHYFWAFRVSDKFGDYGLSGAVGLEVQGEIACITDYILSCRVMGRRIEESLLYVAIQQSLALGAKTVVARFNPTDGNGPCQRFFESSPMRYDQQTQTFEYRANDPFPAPMAVSIDRPSPAKAA